MIFSMKIKISQKSNRKKLRFLRLKLFKKEAKNQRRRKKKPKRLMEREYRLKILKV